MIIRLDSVELDISCGIHARKQAWIGDERIEMVMCRNTVTVTSNLIPTNIARARKVGLSSLTQINFTQEDNSITFNVDDVVKH